MAEVITVVLCVYMCSWFGMAFGGLFRGDESDGIEVAAAFLIAPILFGIALSRLAAYLIVQLLTLVGWLFYHGMEIIGACGRHIKAAATQPYWEEEEEDECRPDYLISR